MELVNCLHACKCSTCKPGPLRGRKRSSPPSGRSYIRLWAAIWELGTELGSWTRTGSGLNHLAIFLFVPSLNTLQSSFWRLCLKTHLSHSPRDHYCRTGNVWRGPDALGCRMPCVFALGHEYLELGHFKGSFFRASVCNAQKGLGCSRDWGDIFLC